MAKKARKANGARSKEEQRRYNMSRVKGKDTKIELAFRKALWSDGIRYRKNYALLPGKPDIAIPKHRIAIFCDGEFWHGKDWDVKKFRIKSNKEYWFRKIERNMRRDCENERSLARMGWHVMRFWGRDIQKNLTMCVDEVKEAIIQACIDLCDAPPEDGGMDELDA
ncbi:MAG: very short patch repair endonuclease [Synergistaceae bacterium]|jgi:DNA mismatch endonuclease (patch repair protein)|nr:very short patch repair endonuclease [Synergistaceae bacterium]